jgi:hypothetical protein
VIWLFKTEDPSSRTVEGTRGRRARDLEWIARYNGSHLLEPLGYVPAEFETAYHDPQAAPVDMAALT